MLKQCDERRPVDEPASDGRAFATLLEPYVHEALAEGLAGWQVTDSRVTMTDCGYHSTATTAVDFRRAYGASAGDDDLLTLGLEVTGEAKKEKQARSPPRSTSGPWRSTTGAASAGGRSSR